MLIETARSIYTDTFDKISPLDYGVTCCGKPLELMKAIRHRHYGVKVYRCKCGNEIRVRTRFKGGWR